MGAQGQVLTRMLKTKAHELPPCFRARSHERQRGRAFPELLRRNDRTFFHWTDLHLEHGQGCSTDADRASGCFGRALEGKAAGLIPAVR